MTFAIKDVTCNLQLLLLFAVFVVVVVVVAVVAVAVDCLVATIGSNSQQHSNTAATNNHTLCGHVP